mmetsp:Transcript_4797/g.16525  ORF Transcript_4797/g.16525 Transcript_4797/m.16525 type:complete len:236 (+) Transcript_4797:899-1606(+)
MDAQQHRHTRARESAHRLHHFGGVGAVEPRGRLVEEEDAGAGEELGPDAHTALLAAAQAAHKLVADEGVRHFAEPEQGNHLRHSPQALLAMGLLREAQLGVEPHVFADGCRSREHVVLGHVPGEVPHGAALHNESIDPNVRPQLCPRPRPQPESQSVEERRLSRAARPEDGEHAAFALGVARDAADSFQDALHPPFDAEHLEVHVVPRQQEGSPAGQAFGARRRVEEHVVVVRGC